MSFVEFLLEYYIYILAVLIILIVGVIGFLVDSKNKEKKQMINNIETNNSGSIAGNVGMSNVNSVVDGGVTNGVAQNFSNQAGNGLSLNGMAFNNVDVNSNNVNSNIGSVTGVDSGMNIVQNMEPVMANNNVNTMPENNFNVVNNMNNEISGIREVQSDLSNMSVNQQPVMNDNFGIGMVNNQGVDNMVNNMQAVQPLVSNIGSVQTPIMPSGVGVEMSNNSMINNVIGVQGLQPEMSTEFNTPISAQASQPQVSMNLNTSPIENINVGNEMGSSLNVSMGMSPLQNVQPIVNTSNVEGLSFEPVTSNIDSTNSTFTNASVTPNVNSNLVNQNQMGNMMMNQQSISNGTQVGMYSGVQNTYMAGQQINNGNVQSNNVVTSDGSQPFDISSMFANNQ